MFNTAVNAITSDLKAKRNIAYEEYLFHKAKQEKGDNNGILHPTQAISKNMRVHRYRPRDQVTNYPELPINKTASKSIDQLNDNAGSPTKPRKNHGAYRQPSHKFGKTTARGGQKIQQQSTRLNKWNWNSGKGMRDPTPSSSQKCRNCSDSYPHQGGKTGCPAYGKECRSCGKLNHFKTVCKSAGEAKMKGFRPPKPSGRRHDIRNLSDSSDEEEYNIFRINMHNPRHDEAKYPVFNVKINGTWLSVIADSGSSIDILDEVHYRKLKQTPDLQDAKVKIYP